MFNLNSISYVILLEYKKHGGTEKTTNFALTFYSSNAPKQTKLHFNDCIQFQLNKVFPNKKKQKNKFFQKSLNFNQRISFETKGPKMPYSEGNSKIMVNVDAFTHYVALITVLNCNDC